jgi:hypothetical protein
MRASLGRGDAARRALRAKPAISRAPGAACSLRSSSRECGDSPDRPKVRDDGRGGDVMACTRENPCGGILFEDPQSLELARAGVPRRVTKCLAGHAFWDGQAPTAAPRPEPALAAARDAA